MPRVKINDLSVDLEELRKKDPEILKKIRGGILARTPTLFTIYRPQDSKWGTLCDTCNFGCPSTGKY